MQASEGLDFVQRHIRAEAKQENRESRSGQLEFPASTFVSSVRTSASANIKAYWLSKLSPAPRRFGIDDLADMLEETGWFESDFQAAFGELQQAGKVRNIDAAGQRRTRYVHFEANRTTGERLKLE